MSDELSTFRLVPMIAIVIIVAIGVAYLLFLAATWHQLQTDRSASFAKIDKLLDRIPVKPAEPQEAEGTAA